jgi:hypothetical protein
MDRIRTSIPIPFVVAALVFLVSIATAQTDTVEVTLGWAASPTQDADGEPLAEAVRYDVYLQRAGGPETRIATVESDTVYTLAAERGVVQRIRVIGHDAAGRPSEPSEWSDPIYFAVQRGSEGAGEPPAAATLNRNYPNPFNPETIVSYGVPEGLSTGTRQALEIFNLRGVRIRSFPVETSPGWHEVTWNGLDDHGRLQPTGTYVARYVCGDEVQVTKMTMVK